MGVTRPAAGPALRDGDPDAPADLRTAATFLRGQAEWLRRGLACATDPEEVGIVLAAHEGSHERWVGLVATAHRALGPDAAQTVATLYGYHGRIIGSLEQRTAALLDAGTAAQFRALLAERLTTLTEVAVEALEGRAGG
ncbi:MAG: hypothetical protein ACRDU8_05210 [Egibacteraceae bacterium]